MNTVPLRCVTCGKSPRSLSRHLIQSKCGKHLSIAERKKRLTDARAFSFDLLQRIYHLDATDQRFRTAGGIKAYLGIPFPITLNDPQRHPHPHPRRPQATPGPSAGSPIHTRFTASPEQSDGSEVETDAATSAAMEMKESEKAEESGQENDEADEENRLISCSQRRPLPRIVRCKKPQ